MPLVGLPIATELLGLGKREQGLAISGGKKQMESL